MVTCPSPPVFARPNILVASFATQAVVASFATQARACILSDHNIFYTPRGGGNGGVMPLGLFLLFLYNPETAQNYQIFLFQNVIKQTTPKESTALKLSFVWSQLTQLRISFTDSKIRTN